MKVGSALKIQIKGCLIVINASKTENNETLLGINDKLDISFQLPGVEKELTVTAAQRNFMIGKESIRIGTEFINMGSEVQSELYKFLSKAIV